MGISFWHIAFVVILILLLFGRGKLPQLMGDLAQGIKSFKQGIRDEDNTSTAATTPNEIERPKA
jgi:sec-independent protein translocase protein TatA